MLGEHIFQSVRPWARRPSTTASADRVSSQTRLWRMGWDGDSAALAVGLTIARTGEHIRAAKLFGVGFHDNSWTFASSKLWGGKDCYKVALNLKVMTSLSFPGNLMYTTYISSDEISWYGQPPSDMFEQTLIESRKRPVEQWVIQMELYHRSACIVLPPLFSWFSKTSSTAVFLPCQCIIILHDNSD